MDKVRQRIQYIDLAKGICIFYIMALHSSVSMPLLTYIAMPLFFFLSGFFFRTHRRIVDTIISKVGMLLIPIAVFNVIGEMYYWLESQLFTAAKDYEFEILKSMIFLKNANGPLWFLMALFIDAILMLLILKISKNALIDILLISAIIFATDYFNLFSSNFYYFKSAILSMPYYYLGFVFGNSYEESNYDGRSLQDLIVGISLMALGAVMSYFYNDDIGFHGALIIGNPFRFYVTSLACSIGLLLICRYVRQVRILNYIGTYSLIIVCFHMLYVNFVAHIVLKFLPGSSYMGIITLAIISLLCLFTIPLSIKYIPWAIGQRRLNTDTIRQLSSLIKSKMLFIRD